jgi:hypothetical protein
MVYNTQNHWVYSTTDSSGILNTREYNLPETGSLCHQMRGESSSKALNRVGISLPHLRMETDPVTQ